APPILAERPRTAENCRRRLYERELQVFGQRAWQRLAMPLLQLWFRIEQIELAWRAFHIKKDDVFRLRREMRRLRGERIRLRRRIGATALLGQQACQCDRPDPATRAPEKITPAQCRQIPVVHDYSRVMNSSELSSARATPNHAAASAGSTCSNSVTGISSPSFGLSRARRRRRARELASVSRSFALAGRA